MGHLAGFEILGQRTRAEQMTVSLVPPRLFTHCSFLSVVSLGYGPSGLGADDIMMRRMEMMNMIHGFYRSIVLVFSRIFVFV